MSQENIKTSNQDLIISNVMNTSQMTVGTENDDDNVVMNKFIERRESKYYQADSSNERSHVSIGTKWLQITNEEIIIYDSNDSQEKE